MGTISPPPGSVYRPPPTQRSTRSIWGHPVLLVAGAGLLVWAAYRAGQQSKTPTATPGHVAEIVLSLPFRQTPLPAARAIVQDLNSAAAEPEPIPFSAEDRGGSGTAMDVRTGLSTEAAATFQALEAEERCWRDRASVARGRLERAQASLQNATALNPAPAVIVNGWNAGGYAAAEVARNAALTPYRMEADAAQGNIDRLAEECRKAGCQPGWVR